MKAVRNPFDTDNIISELSIVWPPDNQRLTSCLKVSGTQTVNNSPINAIPIVEPSEKNVAERPEATPSLFRGTEPIIALLFGAKKSPLAAPTRRSHKKTSINEGRRADKPSTRTAIAKMAEANKQSGLDPILSERHPLVGPKMLRVIGIATSIKPA